MPNAFNGLGASAPYVPDYLQDEIQFRIDNDLRTIAIPADGVVLGVVGDKNVNHVNFQMPAWYNGFNMSLFQARINFIDAGGNANYYTVTDMTVLTPEGNEVVGVPSEDDIIYFTWLVDSYATGYVGQVRFNVRLTKFTGSALSQAFNTQINSCQVLEGIQLADEITQEQAEDILFHYSSELGDITEGFKRDLEAKAAETLETIPEGYEQLSSKVSILSDDVDAITDTRSIYNKTGTYTEDAGTTNFFKVCDITVPGTITKIKRRAGVPESTVSAIILRNGVVSNITSLTDTADIDGDYVIDDVNIPVKSGDALFIGGALHSISFKVLESSTSNNDIITEFPRPVSIGSTPTVNTDSSVHIVFDCEVLLSGENSVNNKLSNLENTLVGGYIYDQTGTYEECATNNKYYRICTVDKDNIITKVKRRGGSMSANASLAVIRNSKVISITLLSPTSGITSSYVTDTVSIPVESGDSVYIGGAINSISYKFTTEQTPEFIMQEFSGPISVGTTVTVTTPEAEGNYYYFTYDCELSSGNGNLIGRVSELEQMLTGGEAIYSELYDSYSESASTAKYYRLCTVSKDTTITTVKRRGGVMSSNAALAIIRNSKVVSIASLSPTSGITSSYVTDTVSIPVETGDTIYIGGAINSVSFMDSLSDDPNKIVTEIPADISIGTTVTPNQPQTGDGDYYYFVYDCEIRDAGINLLDNVNELTLKEIARENANLSKPLPAYHEIDDTIGFVGRWYTKEVNGVSCHVTNNSGSELYFKTFGASTVTLSWQNMTNTHAYMAYDIDGGQLIRTLCGTSNTITLPDTEEHIVRVITDGITENIGKWQNGTGYALGSVTVNAGSITGLVPHNKLIAFFGDSITEGIRALGIETSDMGDVNSATGAFPWTCCKKLNAISHRIGYGGSGIITNGSFNTAINAVRYFYSGVRAQTVYPDLVVINHGTNDTTSTTFVSSYLTLLDAIKVKFPSVNIVCMIPFGGAHANDIISAVNQREFAYLIDARGWVSSFSDGLHPTAAGAKIAGEKLAYAIKELGLI